ncbi:uncharacterized protein E0L32_001048 [Thyridium curvatum]|uniref:Uncharacterized protein n=1 Tax=Thyridium curvatum TaxID=1093900 RepID=A0A507B3Q1_9PEZI|nr:uncharacterized protein E0L32_001048 [Thyridium curvatum]TPX11230.1 hypothetical protein E0L32_001048 [Thyridium curvatum]
MAASTEFPCSLTLDVPFPTPRLASVALRALSPDKELSPLVHRSFSTTTSAAGSAEENVLRIEYSAATNRMLRVAVNSFMESLGLIVDVMESLDVDVLEAKQLAPAS